MKRRNKLISWGGHCLLLLLALAVLTLTFVPVSASPASYKKSDRDLLEKVRRYQANKQWLQALMYLTAYVEREPAEMVEGQYRAYILSEQAALQDYVDYYVQYGQEYAANRYEIQQCLYGSVRSAQSVPPQAPPILGPSPDEVIVFVDFNYGGAWVTLPVGNYYTAEQTYLPNDSISALKVGSNVRAYLCMHGSLTSPCESFTQNDPDLSNNVIGNDQVTSIRVERRTACVPGPNEVALFLNFDYQPPCEVKILGDYANPDQIGLPNDSISSLRVGQNARAVLCMHGGFTPPCETFTWDDPNLSDNLIGSGQTTSVRVEKNQ
ncbi:MAG: hypothetical protein HS114_29780 [Anaerolineales bacterium]|nr:hypothetical protein [Anaerolineales bacterium]